MRLALILLAAILASRAHAQVAYPPFPSALTANHCIKALNSFQGADAGAACGTGTVNSGSQNQLAWYAAAGSAVSGLATANNGALVTSSGGVPSISSTLPAAVQSNITGLGTIAAGTWNGTIVGAAYGGTGVNNGASTITLGGSLTLSGAFATTLTVTGGTALTLPTSGTVTALGNASTGSGSVVLATAPTISNPVLTGLSTTPGSKQPLCIDTSTGAVYKGTGGAC